MFRRTFEDYNLLAWLRRLRERRLEAYSVALLTVTLATLLRFSLAEPLVGAASFATYKCPALWMGSGLPDGFERTGQTPRSS